MLQSHAADIVSILVGHGVRRAVVSPGSRSAPLVLALARHGGFELMVAADERAGGYMALGMALATGTPVALVCTSGTAALNYGPALAEALLSHIPLIVLTADRSPEQLGQQDGQAVWQEGMYGRHVKAWYALPARPTTTAERAHILRICNQAMLLALQAPAGPVHINIPFAEPFYPREGEDYDFSHPPIIWELAAGPPSLTRPVLTTLQAAWQAAPRRAIIAGQMRYDHDLRNAISALLYYSPDVALIADPASNLHALPGAQTAALVDFYLGQRSELRSRNEETLGIDVALHIGGPLTSRKLRHALRETCKEVWRIQPYGADASTPLPDPFLALTKLIVAEPTDFIARLGEHAFFDETARPKPLADTAAQAWAAAAAQAIERRDILFPLSPSGEGRGGARPLPETGNLAHQGQNPITQPTPGPTPALPMGGGRVEINLSFTEGHAVAATIAAMPDNAILHLANSMAVRWAGWLGNPAQGVQIWANRGASGIDGCTSTAVGHALCTDKPVWLITGETAFLYDRNGLWLGHGLPPNLRIVVLNNGGGVIFRLIDGPANLPERDALFENRHQLTTRSTAEDFSLHYCAATDQPTFEAGLAEIANQPGPALLEFFSEPAEAENLIEYLRN